MEMEMEGTGSEIQLQPQLYRLKSGVKLPSDRSLLTDVADRAASEPDRAANKPNRAVNKPSRVAVDRK